MSTGTLGELRIPVPPMTLQQKFSQAVERVEQLHLVHQESLRQVEHLFQTLLHQAFADELGRVTDAVPLSQYTFLGA